jgi:hypothetical protein
MLTVRVCLFGALLAAAAADHTLAQAAAPVCHGAQHPGTVAELMFGRDIGRHVGVSLSAWKRFVAREISPRFPDGLTVISAAGQWRDRSSGAVVSEPSELVLIVLPGSASDQSKLDAIVAAYKRQFHQHSVGVIEQPACVLF